MKEYEPKKELIEALEKLTEEIKYLRRDFREYFGRWDDDYLT